MDVFENGLVSGRIDRAVGEIRINGSLMFALQSSLHGAGAGRSSNNWERGVRRAKAAGEMLCGKHVKMIADKRELGLMMKMFNSGGFVAAGGDAKGGILDLLDGFKGGVACIWRPDSGGIVDFGLDVSFESTEQELFLAAPASASKSAEHPKLLLAGLD